jgi:hypothetical protein
MYRLLLNVTMEMHTVGSGMRLAAVQFKDPSGSELTTLKPNTREKYLSMV